MRADPVSGHDRDPRAAADAAVRALAVEWLARLDRLADGMFDHLQARIPVLDAHAELRGLTRASCSSNVETILSMLGNGIPSSATVAPVTALEHARAMATVGAEVDDTLRFYRLGHGWFLDHWTRALDERVEDREALLAALGGSAAFALEYIDVVSTRVSAEHLAERERRQRRAVVLRGDLVRALMDGEAVDVAAAERGLGHRFAGPQTAFVCWSTREGPELERVAAAVAEALGPGRPLLVLESPRVLGGWVAADGTFEQDALDAAVRDAGPHVAVAVGASHPGLDGFVRSRREADRARRVAGVLGDRRAVVGFADVALLDLLTADLSGARAFVRDELGDLARDDEATAAVRRTVLAVVAPRGGAMAAARELDLHRNTVLQRIHRAETLRGASIEERPRELFLALTLACGLDPAALRDPAVDGDGPAAGVQSAHRRVPDAH
ncbi:CdaR family transcriptional regulator [Patulibacter sp.]|uniref:PucR family transcriptional regulator n=1 Tax=Patulibacter sp. TaxID=1912859 RepID=UPI0027236D30|nr:helix-turn-helix domain-containing protein [Patulibacter sp.]MDO9410211.1 helix-turn-helix domain-containing protein [Patulibacter sp.]